MSAAGTPMVLAPESRELLAFAHRAADHFLAHPKHHTYTDGPIEEGVRFGVRWGADLAAAHAVLVLEVGRATIVGDLDHDRAWMAASAAQGEVVDDHYRVGPRNVIPWMFARARVAE